MLLLQASGPSKTLRACLTSACLFYRQRSLQNPSVVCTLYCVVCVCCCITNSPTPSTTPSESSITIDDVTVVINSCRVNVASFDSTNNMPQFGPQVRMCCGAVNAVVAPNAATCEAVRECRSGGRECGLFVFICMLIKSSLLCCCHHHHLM